MSGIGCERHEAQPQRGCVECGEAASRSFAAPPGSANTESEPRAACNGSSGLVGVGGAQGERDWPAWDDTLGYPHLPGASLPPVLDVCCGSRMMWLDKEDARALFVDKRRETWAADLGTESTKGRTPIVVNPDVLADFTELPFPADSFAHVVFDPPHIEQLEETAGLLTKKYGSLVGDWREMLRGGFSECFRVLKPGGTLIFKWNAVNIPLREILALTPEKPLYGHRSGTKATTHWIAFLKSGGLL